ncbi:MAG: glycoside hydrolase family 31 protein, partial [Oscillospiraceae bacterium]|nr:glycoside hydrolase family 31 protein [Oscillospiraceae bacterium]
MKQKTEEYVWVTFGNSDKTGSFNDSKSGGAVLLALGQKFDPVAKICRSNNFFLSSSIEEPWGEREPIETATLRHAVITISDEMFSGVIDGKTAFEYPLPQNYNGGYIGIGTNSSGIKISDIVLDGRSAEPSEGGGCYFSADLVFLHRQEMPANLFYLSHNGVYERTANGGDVWIRNVPLLFLRERRKAFSLEFDFSFNALSQESVGVGEKVRDPFGTFIFGPPPQEIFSNWDICGELSFAKKHERCFELGFSIFKKEKSLFVSLPKLGGVRISTEPPQSAEQAPVEETAIFEPKETLGIEESDELIGSDGTKIKLITDKRYWAFEIYNAENKLIHVFNRWNLMFADDRGVVKQFRILLPLDEKESVFGTGERFSEFNQRGKRIYFWNTDPCYHGRPLSGDCDLWRGYKNVPIVSSSRGYTMFVNTAANGKGDFGHSEPTQMEMEFDDDRLDFYFWTGTPIENLIKYTDLTGKQLLPPKWAFEYMAGGSNGFWYPGGQRFADIYVPKLEALLKGYAELGTPLAAVYCEGDVGVHAQAYRLAQQYNTRILTWQCADVSHQTAKELYPDSELRDLPF